MAEELRFFLRIALFTLATAVVYWFLSYDVIGTFLLAFVVLGATFFFVVVAGSVRESRSEIVSGEPGSKKARVLGIADRVLGFAERPGPAAAGPLSLEEEPIPQASVWPVVVALAALLVGLGLIYGGWLWVPGVLVGAVATWGWLTELDA